MATMAGPATPSAERSAGAALATEDREITAARTLARWLDDRMIDPLLGFVLPGIGDLLGSAFGLYVVSIAVRRRLPPVVVARMLLNLAADSVLGAVPLLGDLADLGFRAHRRNVDLLVERHALRRASWRDWLLVVGAAVALAAALAAMVWAAVALVRAVF